MLENTKTDFFTDFNRFGESGSAGSHHLLHQTNIKPSTKMKNEYQYVLPTSIRRFIISTFLGSMGGRFRREQLILVTKVNITFTKTRIPG
jgi:hypothetical protein